LQDDIKVDLKKLGWKDTDFINLPVGVNNRRPLVNRALHVPV